jgi:hypothetical protein
VALTLTVSSLCARYFGLKLFGADAQPHAWPVLPGGLLSDPGCICALLHPEPFHICAVLLPRYLDGAHFFTVKPRSLTQDGSGWYSGGPNAGPYSPFDKPFHLLINLALGGDFTQEPWGTMISRDQVGSPFFIRLLQSSEGPRELRLPQITRPLQWCCWA